MSLSKRRAPLHDAPGLTNGHLRTPPTASLEGHFDAPAFPLEQGHEKKEPIPLEDLKTGPTFVVNFSANMSEILEVHETDMDVVVQPGVPYEQLNEDLKSKGLFFPVDVGQAVPPLMRCNPTTLMLLRRFSLDRGQRLVG